MLRGADIICISSQDWDRMWGTMHQVMSRLAEANRVLYVEEPVTMLAPLKVPAHWRRFRAVAPTLRKVQSGLWALTPPPLLPFANMRPAVNRANQAILARYILRAARQLGFGPDILLWTYLPNTVDLVDRLLGAGRATAPEPTADLGGLPTPPSGPTVAPSRSAAPGLVVFHCVDDHAAFPGFVAPEVVKAYDDALTRRADLVITSSESLASSRRPLNPHTHTVLNAAEVDLFSQALEPNLPVPADLAAIPAPRLEIIGALDYRVDLEALEALADADPSWQIVLIGPVKSSELERTALRRRANVHFLGERPHAELPGYLRGASVALIPYVNSRLTEAIFPLKLFEYLAAGVPVVVGGLPELRRFADVIGVAESAADYPGLVREALTGDSPVKEAARVALAAGNTWDARAEDISRLVEEALQRRTARRAVPAR